MSMIMKAAPHGPGFSTERDPVLDAIRRAPRMSPEECEQYRALCHAVESAPKTWLTAEQFNAKIDAEQARREASRT